jgi:hypothetical protein
VADNVGRLVNYIAIVSERRRSSIQNAMTKCDVNKPMYIVLYSVLSRINAID